MNRQSATAIQRGIAAVDALTWKPGPPPLDRPGLYVTNLKREGFQTLCHVYVDGTCDALGCEWPEITHHFPIPSPPSGDTE